jgi:hypothetical protein
MCFSRSQAQMDIFVGDSVDVLFNLDVNEYNGRKSVQLIVRDIHPSEEEGRRLAAERARFEEVWNGATFTAEEGILPCRDDFVAVYTLVSRLTRGGIDTFSHRALLSKLHAAGSDIGYIKLKMIIRVFQELNLMGIEEIAPENYRFTVSFTGKKTDLEKSNRLRHLRAQLR